MKKVYNILIFIIAALLFILVYDFRNHQAAEKAPKFSKAFKPINDRLPPRSSD